MDNSMNIPEIETLSYHSSLCKCPECKRGHKPPKSLKRGFMGLGCNKPQQCHNTMTGRECIGCEIDAAGKCHLSKPKDNPGPLEKLIMDRIEHDLENIAANLEMLRPETKEQKRAKCVLTLEIAHIIGEGGIFDDLKEAFE